MLDTIDFVEAHLYDNQEAVIQDALRHLLRSRPDLRIQLAIHHYQTKQISLARAAHLAGVSWAQMRDILLEQGIPLQLGPENEAFAQDEVAQLRQFIRSQPNL